MENVSELWDIDLSDYYIAGVEENGHTDGLYVNFGVILMNLDKLRRDGMSRKLIDAVNTEKFGCPEQDAFNKYCAGHILKLPDDYNCTVYSHITGEPMYERILHYAGLK
jgi:lipopolysaccharide biosynthesis glycosyltransferase